MYDRILVPVDGSACAERAVGYGTLLGEAYDAELELVYVHTGSRSEDAEGESGETRGETLLAAAREQVGARVPVETTLLEGVAHRTVASYAVDSGADLVVMGRRGRTGLGEGLLGSVTERVLVGVDVPVVVVPEADPGTDTAIPDGLSSVLLPTDGSENAEAASGNAVDLVERFGAELHVVNVVDAQSAGGLFNAGGLTDELVDRLDEAGMEAVSRMVTAVHAVDSDVEPTTAVVHGPPHEGIHDYVVENGVDLVVMGSRGRSNIEQQLFGSVTKRVLRVVDVPVLVVRGEE